MITVLHNEPTRISVSLNPCSLANQYADWWIVAMTSFGWYSYVYPTGWVPGINLCIQIPLFSLFPPFEVYNHTLPQGRYTFYFAVDDNANGIVDATWLDLIKVIVIE